MKSMVKSLLAVLAVMAFLWTHLGYGADAGALDGKWHFVFDTEGGDREFNAVFEQTGAKVSGKWDIDGAKTGGTPLAGTMAGKELTLEFPVESPEAGPGILKLKGTVAEDGTMSGTWSFADYSGNYKAARVKADAAK